MEWLVSGLGVLLVVLGVAGTLLPILPGAAMVFGGLWLIAWADSFAHVGAFTFVLLGGLTIAAYAVDLAAGTVGAKRVNASRRAVWGAAAGTLVGLFFGIPGILLGPFLGAVAGEYSVHRDLRGAGRVGVGTWLGLALAAAAKVALVFAMLGTFTAAWVL